MSVKLIATPRCPNCGHIFSRLHIEHNEYGYSVFPSQCPSCGEGIMGIQFSFPGTSEYDYDTNNYDSKGEWLKGETQ